jgi:hypothetical protein
MRRRHCPGKAYTRQGNAHKIPAAATARTPRFGLQIGGYSALLPCPKRRSVSKGADVPPKAEVALAQEAAVQAVATDGVPDSRQAEARECPPHRAWNRRQRKCVRPFRYHSLGPVGRVSWELAAALGWAAAAVRRVRGRPDSPFSHGYPLRGRPAGGESGQAAAARSTRPGSGGGWASHPMPVSHLRFCHLGD